VALLLATPGSALTCAGDCDGDGAVTVDEIVAMVTIALDLEPVDICRSSDRDGNNAVEIDEVIAAVSFALNGCPSSPTATPAVPTATATQTPPATCAAAAPAVTTPKASSACVALPGMFVDCFETSGLDVGPYQGQNGAAVADIDGDGLPDVFLWSSSGTARLFRNLGHDMQFESIADSAPVWLGEATVIVAAFGDLDNDGKPDLVVSVNNEPIKVEGAIDSQTDAAYPCDGVARNAFSNHVYRNLGGGHFDEVTDAWGFSQRAPEPGDSTVRRGLSLVDLNLDGRLDVVEFRFDPDTRPLTFLSQPDGMTWREAGRDVFGDARGLTWNVFFTDSNHDQLLDAFVLNDYWEDAPSKWYVRTDRSVTYEERDLSPLFGTAASGAPMGAATADLNGDGELNLVVTDTGDQHVFSSGRNVEDAWNVKQNPSRYGIQQNCWSVAVIDLENDGKPDLFFTCAGFEKGWPDRATSFVLRNKGGTFQPAPGVLPNEDVPTWEDGLAVADFDQDGRLDILTGGEGSPPRLLWNQIPAGHALALRLKGRRGNAQGIGARVEVKAAGLPMQVREMFPGGATWGYSDSQLLFGMGAATFATVTVDWRPAGGAGVQTVELPPGATVIEEP